MACEDAAANIPGAGTQVQGQQGRDQAKKRLRFPGEDNHHSTFKRRRCLVDEVRCVDGGGLKRKRKEEDLPLLTTKAPRFFSNSDFLLEDRLDFEQDLVLTLLICCCVVWHHGWAPSPERAFPSLQSPVRPRRALYESVNGGPTGLCHRLRQTRRCPYSVRMVGTELTCSSLVWYSGIRGSKIDNYMLEVAEIFTSTCPSTLKRGDREAPSSNKTGIGWILLHFSPHQRSKPIDLTQVNRLFICHFWILAAASFKANAHAGNGFTSCRFEMGSSSAHTSEGESSSLANDHHQAGTAEKRPRPQA